MTISGGRGEPSDVGPNGPLRSMEHAFNQMARSLRELFEDIEHGSLNGRGAKRSGGVPFASWAEAELKPAMGFLSVLKRMMA